VSVLFSGLSDPDAKQKYIVSLLSSLPEPNKSTMSYIIDHILRFVVQAIYFLALVSSNQRASITEAKINCWLRPFWPTA